MDNPEKIQNIPESVTDNGVSDMKLSARKTCPAADDAVTQEMKKSMSMLKKRLKEKSLSQAKIQWISVAIRLDETRKSHLYWGIYAIAVTPLFVLLFRYQGISWLFCAVFSAYVLTMATISIRIYRTIKNPMAADSTITQCAKATKKYRAYTSRINKALGLCGIVIIVWLVIEYIVIFKTTDASFSGLHAGLIGLSCGLITGLLGYPGFQNTMRNMENFTRLAEEEEGW
jgi:hypothetical protein